MFNSIRKLLGFQRQEQPRKCKNDPLFNGYACFSKRVPDTLKESWVKHGGGLFSSGIARATYFFAIDTAEEWVATLTARSVTVVHADWIAHCINQNFHLPISSYVLDDYFIPRNRSVLPFKPIVSTPTVTGLDMSDLSSGSTDPPSTPNISRKRKREPAYYDSASGSFTSSGFDKEGIPRRPRKQRRLRFDPSFSPGAERKKSVGLSKECDSSDNDQGQVNPNLAQDVFMTNLHIAAKDFACGMAFASDGLPTASAVEVNERVQSPLAGFQLHSTLSPTTMRSAPTPNHRLGAGGSAPVRAIDFTCLPQSTHRFRLPVASTTPCTCPLSISIVQRDSEVNVQKKITFAEHATVRVYQSQDDEGAEGLQDDKMIEKRTGSTTADDEDMSLGDPIPMRTRDDAVSLSREPSDLDFRTDVTPISPLGLHADTMTLKVEQVQAMRKHLLRTLRADVEDEVGQLAVLFKLGESFRGMKFRHEW